MGVGQRGHYGRIGDLTAKTEAKGAGSGSQMITRESTVQFTKGPTLASSTSRVGVLP